MMGSLMAGKGLAWPLTLKPAEVCRCHFLEASAGFPNFEVYVGRSVTDMEPGSLQMYLGQQPVLQDR